MWTDVSLHQRSDLFLVWNISPSSLLFYREHRLNSPSESLWGSPPWLVRTHRNKSGSLWWNLNSLHHLILFKSFVKENCKQLLVYSSKIELSVFCELNMNIWWFMYTWIQGWMFPKCFGLNDETPVKSVHMKILFGAPVVLTIRVRPRQEGDYLRADYFTVLSAETLQWHQWCS